MACRDEHDLLKLLPIAAEAAFNSYDKRHNSFCLENTRIDVLNEISTWADGYSEKCIFWLNGMAGTGKSTIARTVANNYYKQKRLGASFFFSRGGGDVSDASKFFTTIARQLVNLSPVLCRHIREAIAEQKEIASQTPRDQWNQLILQPLSKLNDTLLQSSIIVVIDALDECEEDNDIKLLLQLFASANNLRNIRLRIFVTSRPDTPIRLGFRTMSVILHHDLVLHDISRTIVDHDISLFFKVQFREIRDNSEYLPADWPGKETMDLLVERAEGLFIYAATVCRFIKSNDRWPPQHILEVFLPSNGMSHLEKQTHKIPSTSPTSELDAIYTHILKRSIKGVREERERNELANDFKQVIGSVAILSEPLSATALGQLLIVDQETIHLTLCHLRSVLNMPEDQDSPIRLLHPSFRDFLLDKERCSDQLFWVDEKKAHQVLTRRCLQRLTTGNTRLKRDICSLHAPSALAAKVESSQVEQYLPTDLQYACRYWVQHLQKSGLHLYDDDPVYMFLQEHLLHWFEALSLIGKTSEGVRAVASLESIVKVSAV